MPPFCILPARGLFRLLAGGGFVRGGCRLRRRIPACCRMVQPAVAGPAGGAAHDFGLRSGVSVFVRDAEEGDLVLAFCDEVVFRSG